MLSLILKYGEGIKLRQMVHLFEKHCVLSVIDKKDNFPFDSPTFFVGENFRKLTWNNGLMINLNALMLND